MKREPIQEWYDTGTPAPKTTVVQVWPTWAKPWAMCPKGSQNEPLPFYTTWREAWDAALAYEGLR